MIASRGNIAAEAIFIKKTIKSSVGTAVLTCVFALAAIGLLAGGLAKREAELARRDRELEAVYSRALTTLVTSVGELETSLSLTCSVCTDVFGKAYGRAGLARRAAVLRPLAYEHGGLYRPRRRLDVEPRAKRRGVLAL